MNENLRVFCLCYIKYLYLQIILEEKDDVLLSLSQVWNIWVVYLACKTIEIYYTKNKLR